MGKVPLTEVVGVIEVTDLVVVTAGVVVTGMVRVKITDCVTTTLETTPFVPVIKRVLVMILVEVTMRVDLTGALTTLAGCTTFRLASST